MVIMPSRSPVDSIVKPLISDTSSSSTGGNFKAHYYLVTAGSGQDPAPLAIAGKLFQTILRVTAAIIGFIFSPTVDRFPRLI